MSKRENDTEFQAGVSRTGSRTRRLGSLHERTILSISADASDHLALRRALSNQFWHVEEASNYQQAVAHLCRSRVDVVVCASRLPDGTWKDLLSHIAAIPDPPTLVVTSHVVDENICAEVHNLGGYAVLAKPLKSTEAEKVLLSAWQAHRIDIGIAVL